MSHIVYAPSSTQRFMNCPSSIGTPHIQCKSKNNAVKDGVDMHKHLTSNINRQQDKPIN